MSEHTAKVSMEKIVSLCRRRGFIFPSSEIYGGLSSCWDYGPLGVEMKQNIKQAWWQAVVRKRDDMVGLDTSILMHPQVWQASGHVTGFSDPMVECQNCHQRFRPDQIMVGAVTVGGEFLGYASGINGEEYEQSWINVLRKHPVNTRMFEVRPTDKTLQDYLDVRSEIPCPFCKTIGHFTEP